MLQSLNGNKRGSSAPSFTGKGTFLPGFFESKYVDIKREKSKAPYTLHKYTTIKWYTFRDQGCVLGSFFYFL
jgi:hypothetical protein